MFTPGDAGAASRVSIEITAFGRMLAVTILSVLLASVFYVVIQRLAEQWYPCTTIEISYRHGPCENLHKSVRCERTGVTNVVVTKKNKKPTVKRKTPAKKKVDGLHLPSLTIEGFRGFKKLHLPELGQVTLLAGRNGAGKSTVLEAIQIYASAGDPGIIADILDYRENVLVRGDEGGDLIDVPDYGSLFFGYDEPKVKDAIEIGCPNVESLLKVELSRFTSKELKDIPSSLLSILEEENLKCLTVFSGTNRKIVGKFPFFHSRKEHVQQNNFFATFPRRIRRRTFRGFLNFGNREIPENSQIPFESLGPGLPTSEKISSWYEFVELTPNEERVLEILRLAKPNIEQLASQGSNKFGMPRMMAKIESLDFPVPLKSMGEGALHLLGLAVALFNSKNGFLLVDEVENGIHHSLFPQLWEFVMQTAQENNVQVIAATHSWDCFKGFARVAHEMEDIEGRAVRIERKGEETSAVPYSEEEALIAARSDIEVR